MNIMDECMVNAIAKYDVRVLLPPTFAHYKQVATVVDENNPIYNFVGSFGLKLGKLSRSVGFAQIDCIKFRKESRRETPFGFVYALDRHTVFCFFASIVLIGLAITGFQLRNCFSGICLILESLFGISKNLKSQFYSLFVLWLTVYWLFWQLFSNDMFSNLTKLEEDDVIDSWSDLAERPALKILAVEDLASTDADSEAFVDLDAYQVGSVTDYFNKKSIFYHFFTSRLKVISYYDLQKSENYVMPDGELLNLTSFDGNTVLMSICDTLRYRLHNGFRQQSDDSVHVSKEDGVMMPYFYTLSPFIKEAEVQMFDSM